MNLKFLSKDYPIEKSFLMISKFCLGLMGQFPQPESSKLQTINSCFHFVLLFVGVITQFWYGFYYLNVDLQRGIDAMCPAIACLVSFVKMTLIRWYGKDLSFVIKRLENVLFSEEDQEKTKLARTYSALATNLAFMVLASGVTANVFYGLRPIITNIVRVIMGKEYLYDETPLRVMVPKITLTLPWYPLTYALISYMGNVTVFAFSGVDGIFISFCLYSAAFLKMLQNDILLILEKCSDNQTCCKRLGEIVDRHIQVVNLLTDFTTLFRWIVLSHFVTSSIVIGASIIESVLYPGYALIYLTYTAAVSCDLFIYCYGGSAVLSNSSDIGTSAYFSNWQQYDIKVKKMILMIIVRSQKPPNMTVPFFTPSLETFTSIIRAAGSIIALVKSVI